MKACYNCKNAQCYAGSPDTRDYPGEPGYTECRVALDAKGKVLNQELFDLGESLEWREDELPKVCGHYDPILIEACAHCQKIINSPEHSHEFYAASYYSGDSVPVCSDACRKAFNEKSQAEYEESARQEEEYAREYEKQCRVSVRLSCNGDTVKEDTVKAVDISEDIQGRDVLTFVCPACGGTHESFRLG